MPIETPRDGAFNTSPTIWDQQVPFDFGSGFSGQWVFGPTRIDQSTGDITCDTGTGNITGFNTGSSGFSGFSGISGWSAFSGWSGVSGQSGISGQSGTSGWSGLSGISGWSGSSGQSGTSGASGFSGFSGYSGISGAIGTSGTSGSSGTSGWSGFSGWSGYSGQSGASGASGTSGWSGFSGFSGISGYSGTSGWSGFSGTSGYSGLSGTSGTSGTSGFSGFSGASYGFQMGIGGKLPTSNLPLTNIGIEISPITTSLSNFRARRSTAGTAGTTTIQLEVNGSPVTGATLSWTSSDAAYALKTTIFSAVGISPGDRISFRLTSAETNAQDIHAEAN